MWVQAQVGFQKGLVRRGRGRRRGLLGKGPPRDHGEGGSAQFAHPMPCWIAEEIDSEINEVEGCELSYHPKCGPLRAVVYGVVELRVAYSFLAFAYDGHGRRQMR